MMFSMKYAGSDICNMAGLQKIKFKVTHAKCTPEILQLTIQ